MRRSERLPLITKLLIEKPGCIISLTDLANRFNAAKSTISEDLSIIRNSFAAERMGRIETIAGAAGGVRYIPNLSTEHIVSSVQMLCEELSQPRRILPGGFLYMSDIVSSPSFTKTVGEIFATKFSDQVTPDIVVTLETSGIPLALMTARTFNVPLAIVRRVSRVTEGTVVTMNYVSGSAKRIETMSLSRRALPPDAHVLIVDDFMKAGGTVRGLIDLVGEFGAHVCGTGVFVSTAEPKEKLVKNYLSLIVLERVDEQEQVAHVRPSAWVQSMMSSPKA